MARPIPPVARGSRVVHRIVDHPGETVTPNRVGVVLSIVADARWLGGWRAVVRWDSGRRDTLTADAIRAEV